MADFTPPDQLSVTSGLQGSLVACGLPSGVATPHSRRRRAYAHGATSLTSATRYGLSERSSPSRIMSRPISNAVSASNGCVAYSLATLAANGYSPAGMAARTS
jgi:hypothetical protein